MLWAWLTKTWSGQTQDVTQVPLMSSGSTRRECLYCKLLRHGTLVRTTIAKKSFRTRIDIETISPVEDRYQNDTNPSRCISGPLLPALAKPVSQSGMLVRVILCKIVVKSYLISSQSPFNDIKWTLIYNSGMRTRFSPAKIKAMSYTDAWSSHFSTTRDRFLVCISYR